VSSSGPDVPSDGVCRLLLGPVDSFEKLGVLLALHGAAGVPLSLSDLAAQAHVAAERAGDAAGELETDGLIEQTASRMWRVRSDAAARIGELAAAWNGSRADVLKLMTDRALGRIRSSAARAFADAFRLRRRKDDGGDDNG
jgi:hypothetical protein